MQNEFSLNTSTYEQYVMLKGIFYQALLCSSKTDFHYNIR